MQNTALVFAFNEYRGARMISSTNRFLLSAEECELLLVFEETASLQKVAEVIGRDHSIVSRSLKRISEKLPVVDKKSGRWTLTEMGKQLNEASRAMLSVQSSLGQKQQTLRIGTNREFAARIMGPDLSTILQKFPNTILTINSYEGGTENALLKGQIDLSIDCDRPYNPEIAYKLIAEEPIVAICSKSFYKAHQKKIANKDYLALPHLLCDRLHPDKILSKLEANAQVVAKFNDVATTRAACLQGIGWALLPSYAIKTELAAKSLIQIDPTFFGKSKYGIWWIRHRTYLKDSVDKLATWLSSQQL